MGGEIKDIFSVKWLLLILVLITVYNIGNLTSVSELHEQYLMEQLDTILHQSTGGGSAANKDKTGKNKNKRKIIPLLELTRGNKRVNCTPPLVEVQDRIVHSNNNNNNSSSKIPKLIHVSWRDRCLAPDVAAMTEKWKNNFPHYNFYLHDEEAVEQLLFGQEWEEFPHFNLIIKTCLPYFRGAIKIDVWRVLLLYQYGGIYSDIDTGPGPDLREDTILPDDTAFFVSDDANRPSHWLQAMEPFHPISYFTMWEILRRVGKLKDVSKLTPVYTTGPQALNAGYISAFDDPTHIFEHGVHMGKFNKQIHKLAHKKVSPMRVRKKNEKKAVVYNDYSKWVANAYDGGELVPYNATLNVTKRERAELQMQAVHWKKDVRKNQKDEARITDACLRLLFKSDHPNSP